MHKGARGKHDRSRSVSKHLTSLHVRQKQREKWEEKAAHQGPQGTPQQGSQGTQQKGTRGRRRGHGERGESVRKGKGRAGPGAPTLWDAVDSECVIELPERYG